MMIQVHVFMIHMTRFLWPVYQKVCHHEVWHQQCCPFDFHVTHLIQVYLLSKYSFLIFCPFYVCSLFMSLDIAEGGLEWCCVAPVGTISCFGPAILTLKCSDVKPRTRELWISLGKTPELYDPSTRYNELMFLVLSDANKSVNH